MSNAIEWVKRIYVYAAAGIGLVLIIIGSVQLINLALKTWIFTQADVYRPYPMEVKAPDAEEQQVPTQAELEEYQRKETTSNRQRQAANSLAMIIVGLPVFAYHWRIARKES
jgi:hypothetical protein